MLNHIVVMGRLTRDPELRRTQTGNAVTSFRVAVDRDFKSQSGERETDFIDVVAWRSTAEFVSKYFAKGRMAVVEGRLQIRDWTDRDGNKRTTAEIVANNVYFGDSKRDGDYNGPSSYGASSYGGRAPGYGNAAPGYEDARGGYGEGASSPGAAPGYGGTPASGSPPAPSDFADLGEDDGDLPF